LSLGFSPDMGKQALRSIAVVRGHC
jgi:hypothetical protein